MQLVLVVLAPVAAVALLLVGLLALRARRADVYAPDPEGVRTVALLVGPLADGEPDELGGAGAPLVQALAAALASVGLPVASSHAESYGWVLLLDVDGVRHQVTFGARDEREWVATVVAARGCAVAPRLLAALDGRLRQLDGVTRVSWHPRERFLRGDETGFASPLATAGV